VTRARWTILIVPALLYFLSYFHRVAPVVAAGDLMATFTVSAAALGTLSAIYPYCFAIMALPGGSLTDFLGPGRTLTLGGLSMSAGRCSSAWPRASGWPSRAASSSGSAPP